MFLTWLAHHQSIFLISLISRHRILKALNYVSKVIFIIFDYSRFSIIASNTLNKLDLNGYGIEEDKDLVFVKELLFDVKEAQES